MEVEIREIHALCTMYKRVHVWAHKNFENFVETCYTEHNRNLLIIFENKTRL